MKLTLINSTTGPDNDHIIICKNEQGESEKVWPTPIEELVDQVIARQSEVDAEMLKRGTIAVRWGLEDVESQEDDENPLTEAERIDVLSLMDRKHDAEIGINWDVISCWIDYVISERVKNSY